MNLPMRHETSPSHWNVMKEQASLLLKSGFLPTSVRSPEQAIAVMMKGQELGIPAMQALSQINVIQGKPCVSAELQLALIYRAFPDAKIDFVKLEIDGCHISAARPGGKAQLFKFEESDAKAAQLVGKDNWKKYPRAMYRSRCISEMARSLFPDAIMGCSYTPEEMGAVVDEDGSVIDAPSQLVAKPEAAEAVAETPPPKPTTASTYTGATGQQKIVMGILKARNVPPELWEQINDRLMGKPSTALTGVIDDVLLGL